MRVVSAGGAKVRIPPMRSREDTYRHRLGWVTRKFPEDFFGYEDPTTCFSCLGYEAQEPDYFQDYFQIKIALIRVSERDIKIRRGKTTE